jgi:hypothetical protein
MKFVSRLVEIKILVNMGLVHYIYKQSTPTFLCAINPIMFHAKTCQTHDLATKLRYWISPCIKKCLWTNISIGLMFGCLQYNHIKMSFLTASKDLGSFISCLLCVVWSNWSIHYHCKFPSSIKLDYKQDTVHICVENPEEFLVRPTREIVRREETTGHSVRPRVYCVCPTRGNWCLT